MKRLIGSLVLALCCSYVCGQYIPNNGQAFQFAPVYNPAFSGTDEFVDVKLGYRRQWSGFGDNAPEFLNLSINARLSQPLDLSQNSIRISRPQAIAGYNLPPGKGSFWAMGANVFASSAGQIRETGGGVQVAWHYPIGKKARVSFGAAAMLESITFRPRNLVFHDPNDPFYQHLLSNGSNQLDLAVRAGVLYYMPGFYLGLSTLSLSRQALQESELNTEETFYTAALLTGFTLFASETVAVKPGAVVVLQRDNRLAIDYNLKLYFRERGWLGATYRNTRTGLLLLGLSVSPMLHVTYSYELPMSAFQRFTGSTHEIVLGARLKNFKRTASYVW